MDEIQWRRGQRYLTLVYQIEEGMKRLLWVAEGANGRQSAAVLHDAQRGGPPLHPFCL